MEHIKQHIEERLWNFIKRSYNSEDYKNAILDSIQFIGDVIREKSGLDSDGNQLIGNAFGGTSPKIKLNKLKTESEKNIQKGLESILRGIYSAYRNPRSHSKIADTEEDAFEIIIFVNHLLKIIDKSKGKFSIDTFLRRVFDNDFVQNSKYAELLVKEIPKNKSFEVAIEIFRKKELGRIQNLKLVWTSVKEQLTSEEIEEILKLVSDELRFTDSLKSVIHCIALFKDEWIKLDEDSRLRAENKIIQKFPEAEKDYHGQTNESGKYVSWIKTIISDITLRDELADKIFDSLKSSNYERQKYAIDYFGYHIPDFEEDLFLASFDDVIRKELKDGNILFYDWISKSYKKDFKAKFDKEIDDFEEYRPEDNLPF